MTTRRVMVSCSEGFNEKSFVDRDAAQLWIDQFAREQARNVNLCQGEHKIVEQGAADASPSSA